MKYSLADIALIEPVKDTQYLDFIAATVKQYDMQALHVVRNCLWLETHRQEIESLDISLATGATCIEMFALAANKVEFAHIMKTHRLIAVPSLCIKECK